jgi:transcriptional regulator with XRE-family HTH domain
VRKKRISAGLTQSEVASHLGLSYSTVAMWETGASHPRAIMLPRIAALYGCTVDELLREDSAPPAHNKAAPEGGDGRG